MVENLFADGLIGEFCVFYVLQVGYVGLVGIVMVPTALGTFSTLA